MTLSLQNMVLYICIVIFLLKAIDSGREEKNKALELMTEIENSNKKSNKIGELSTNDSLNDSALSLLSSII